MYWSRTGSLADLILLSFLCMCWSAGGWLLVTHVFRLRPPERPLAGLAAGFLLFIALSNLFANLLPVVPAYWAAALFILVSGLAAAWRSPVKPRLNWKDWSAWPQLAVLAGLTLLFTLIGRGLAIFDDYLHLPLVSAMAAGDIPPHFYLNPGEHFAYHYGLHVFAAGLVRLGGLFPWSAWDFSKAWTIAMTMVLSWAWFRRITGSPQAAALGSLFTGFAGGARWLLLLAPASMLARMSAAVPLINTAADSGANLLDVLSRPWLAEGSGAYPFPFAFHNGIFVPVIFSLGSSSAMPFMTLILLLLLTRQPVPSIPAALILGLIFATLALSAEHIFVFLWMGIAISAAILLLRKWSRHEKLPKALLIHWAAALALSGLLSAVQGGFLTEALRNVLLGLQGVQSGTGGSYNYFSFLPQWPPSLVSAHFGTLSILNPSQLLALLAEIGPVVLLAPAATLYAWKRLRRGDGMAAGLGFCALFSLLLALFFRYGVERSSTRLPAVALWIWALLGFPLLWQAYRTARSLPRVLMGSLFTTAVAAGLVIFAVQLTALPAPQITYYINANDARLGAAWWDRLPENAQVLDNIPYRAVTLFGRPTRSQLDFYHSLPEWEALVAHPEPGSIARSGYDFVYIDDDWWWSIEQEQRDTFKNPCVQLAAEQQPEDEDFRMLLDLRECR